VPKGDITPGSVDHLVGAGEERSRYLIPSAFAVFRLMVSLNSVG
jgi:hypothetical protein